MKQLAYAEWEHIVIVAFGARPPPREEWTAYAEFLRKAAGRRQRGLLFSEGGSLEPYQRKEADQILGPHRERDRRLAVVSGSTFTRGFVKALALFDPSYRAFAPAQLDEALAHLEVPRGGWADVRRVAEGLVAQVR